MIAPQRKWLHKSLMFAFAAVTGLAAVAGTARASSHSDAPLIKLDPQANLTDVYAFVRTRPGGQKVLVMEISVRPFSEPGDGVSYEAFSDDALYSIHVANPTTGATLIRYDFRFSPVSTNGNYKNLDTILRYGRGANLLNGNPDAGAITTVGDAHQNFVQTYTITKTVTGNNPTLLNGNMTLMCPPANTGKRTTPAYNDANGRAVSGAATRAALDNYTRQTTYDLPTGESSFAGSREDGFYADTPGIFDLLDGRILSNVKGLGFGQDGTGVDGFKGFNVLHYSIAVPLSDLPQIAYTGAFAGASNGVGVYASVSRQRITLRSTSGQNTASGPWIQVNREGNPLFNEVLVALRDKDNYNRDSPINDATKYKTYALNPEVAALINVAVFNDPTGAAPLATSGRTDLAAVYIPDVIRVDTTTAATKVSGEAGFNRLSFIGGDTIANSSNVQIPAGWPNGRRFGDDVVDIALTAVASGPSYTTITLVGDNADHNDQVYNMTFPYAGTPHSGTRNSKDSGLNVGF
jgi:hypothetical protein